MVRRVLWLGVVVAVSCLGMTSSSSAVPPNRPSGAVAETPAGPVWMPKIPYDLDTSPPSRKLHLETASYARPVTLARAGIPLMALDAYRSAAALIARSDPSCHLHWSLLAAIGRVESNHGRHGGSTITRDGQIAPPIVGPPLNGAGVALIRDSDGGRFDYDTVFDRAVGPMQFLPGTWRIVGVDGNDDGVADPGNIFDAALSAGRYLCAGTVDLDYPAGLRAAVFRYNHSASYVNLVLSLAEAYRSGGEPQRPVITAAHPPKPLDQEPPPATTGRPPAADPPNIPPSHTPSPSTQPPPVAGSQADGDPASSSSGGTWADRSPTTSSPGDSPADSSTTMTPPATTPAPSESTTPPATTPPATTPPATTPPATTPPATTPPATTPPPTGDESPSPSPTTSSPSGSSPTPSPSGSSSSPSPQPPTVDDLSPATGTDGTEVTIAGSRLEGETVTFGGVPAEVLDKGDGWLGVAAPEHETADAVEVVVTRDGHHSKPIEFTYVPEVASVDPESVRPGATLTVTGERFGPDSTVTLTRDQPDNADEENEPVTRETKYDEDAGILEVTLPDDLKAGPYLLAVTTNGATSDTVEIQVTEVA